MTLQTKNSMIGMQSNVHPILPRLRMIEGFEGCTELTRVGPSWRHAISEPDTLESEPPPNYEEEASQALHDFRAQQERRRRGMIPVMFVMGCSLGILVAIVPHSRFFRAHFSKPAAPAVVVAPAAAPAAPPSEAQSGLAMSPIDFDIDAVMPAMPKTVPTIVGTAPRHARAVAAATPRAATPAPAPAPPATKAPASTSHAKGHSTTEDEETKHARAADDLAATQLGDTL